MQFTSHTYVAAGLGTLSRQVMAHYLYKIFPSDTAKSIAGLFGLEIHRVIVAITVLEQALSSMIILTEQAAYPLLLQTSHEIDKLMAAQIPLEERQLNILRLVLLPYGVFSPLGGISIGNYIRSFQAQIDAHQAVLDNFNNMWTWIEKTKVTYVEDGDTIYVSEFPDTAIRLEGIDCPEIWHEGFSEGAPDDPKWDAGNEAKAFTESQLLGKEVKLRARTERDIYDRIIAKVYFPGDKDFAWTLLGAGHGEMMFSTWFT